LANLYQAAWRFYYGLSDLLLPPCCVRCGRPEVWLCEPCAEALPLIAAQLCPRCGRPVTTPGLCAICRKDPLLVNPIRSAFLFEDEIRELIHALKYRGGRAVAAALGGPMARAWEAYGMRGELLIPVPLHPRRERKRGYNQALLLAQALSRHVGVPVAPHVLRRVRNTVSQTHLDLEGRRRNVADAFAVAAGLQLEAYRVTLVDDVATTGATLNACAQALLQAKARAVEAFTLARAP